MGTVLNFGSLNVDHVYRVARIARPGETVASADYRVFAGGKGANQSVALARAGADVRHAGMLGPESAWLKERLAKEGIDVGLVRIGERPGGHAVIQVDDSGQNSIVIFGGTNREITDEHVAEALAGCQPGDALLLQNEINATAQLIARGAEAGLDIFLNPAPMTPDVADFPLDLVGTLIVNEHEGAALADCSEPGEILDALARRFPDMRVVLTLGEDGAMLRRGTTQLEVPACRVEAVDTTAAGDTFTGYFVAALGTGLPERDAPSHACRAAALSVTRPGAMDSIPHHHEL